MQRLAIDSSSSNDDPDLGCCITEKIFSRCEALLKKEIFPASPGCADRQDKPFSVQETWEEIVQATQKARWSKFEFWEVEAFRCGILR